METKEKLIALGTVHNSIAWDPFVEVKVKNIQAALHITQIYNHKSQFSHAPRFVPVIQTVDEMINLASMECVLGTKNIYRHHESRCWNIQWHR